VEARKTVGRQGAVARPWLVMALAVSAFPLVISSGSEPEIGLLQPISADSGPATTWIGTTTSQGVTVLRADEARTIFGVTGAGIRLGLISDSFDGSGSTPTVATQIAAGNLPGTGNPNGFTTPVTVVKDQVGGGATDEGRAMFEIVHDIAPGALLYFHSAFNNTSTPGYTSVETAAPDQTIADAIDGLAAVANMRIIVDDVGMLTAPRFQDGAAAGAVNAAAGSGIAYFSSAGNSGTDATRVTTTALPGQAVNWGTDTLLQMRINGLSQGRIVLQWGEPYPSVSGPVTTSDFSIDATSVDGTTTFFSLNNQWADEDPYEFGSITNSGSTAVNFALRVNRLSGAMPVVMQLSTFGGALAITDADKTNAPTIFGHAAAEGGVAVAAHFWASPNSVESFSSRGPTLILFDAAGNPVEETRQTPQITAPDGVSTTTAGFSSFFGTSAAAPHAAAVAALMLERFDAKGVTVTPDQLYRVMFDSAVDITTTGTGFDNASGHGRLDALAAVSAGRIWDGNGATAGVPGGGVWSGANWTLEDAGDKPTGVFIRGQQAVFGSGTGPAESYTVTVDDTYAVAGIAVSRDTVTLADGGGRLLMTGGTIGVAAGLTTTVAATLSGTAGLVKAGGGTLVLSGSQAFTGTTTVSQGSLRVNGDLAAGTSLSLAAGTRLGGSGIVAGTVGGAGLVEPGNSPGILSVDSIDPWSGLDFAFEFNATIPDYDAPSASINDVLRLTNPASPFAGPLSTSNIVDVYFNDITSLSQFQESTGTVYEGGFLVTADVDLLQAIRGATFRYWLYGDGLGTSTSYGGLGYYWLRAFDPEWTRTFTLGTRALDGGSSVMILTVSVPEPAAGGLAAVGLIAALAAHRLRRGSDS
jgi:autotransporter-associated beta strand protein